ncbi:unnamed protein product, partial [marine sediment metagenome]
RPEFALNHFWKHKIKKTELLKDVFNIPDTWLSSRFKQVAAREALDMVNSVQEVFDWNKEQILDSITAIENKIQEIQERLDTKQNRRKINNLYVKLKKKKMKYDMMQPHKPKHKSKRMCISALIGELQDCKNPGKFDAWLRLSSIGNKTKIDLPINFHRHFKELNKKGRRLNSYIVTEDNIQFSFEIETGPKKEVKHLIGIDTGINALASTNEGKQFGLDTKEYIEKIKRCKWGSKGQVRARKTLKYKISEIAKRVCQEADLIVVEKLKNLSKNTKLKGR